MFRLLFFATSVFLISCSSKHKISSSSLTEAQNQESQERQIASDANASISLKSKSGFETIVFSPHSCSEAQRLQADVLQQFEVFVSISSTTFSTHTCEEAVQHLKKFQKIAIDTELQKRVRPLPYDVLSISIFSESTPEAIGSRLALPMGYLLDPIKNKDMFFYSANYHTYPSRLFQLKAALMNLPMKGTPAGAEYEKDSLVFNFAYCGTAAEVEYLTRKRIFPLSHCQQLSPFFHGISTVLDAGPSQARKNLHMISDLISQPTLPVTDEIIFMDTRRTRSVKDKFYYASNQLNQTGQIYYDTTLKCVRQYLANRTEWNSEDYARSGCFVVPLN